MLNLKKFWLKIAQQDHLKASGDALKCIVSDSILAGHSNCVHIEL
uniref:Uncharacterized protein n=1 Tax=Anguilla anguilla TaxID=7936 RepID=A0A0E9W7P3_ANGAN